MKRILSLLLVLVIGVTLFTGCSENSVNTDTTETETKTELDGVITDPNERLANKEQAKKEVIEKALKGESVEETKKTNSNAHPLYAHINGNIKEQKIFDNSGIVITAKGFNFEKSDPKFIFEIENTTPYGFELKVENVAINGFMMEASIQEDLYVGDKQEIAMSFLNGSILSNRIETIEDITFTINMTGYDEEPPYIDLTTGEVVLKTGLKAEEYPEIANGTTVFNTNGIKIIYLDMEYGTEWTDTTLYFYVENNTDKEISYAPYNHEALINGKKVDIAFGHNITPNKKFIDRMTIMDKKLAEKDISVIETIEVNDFKCINNKYKLETIFEGGFLLEDLQDTVIVEEKTE